MEFKKITEKGVKKAFEINPRDSFPRGIRNHCRLSSPSANENRILASFGLKLGNNPARVLMHFGAMPIYRTHTLESEDVAFKIAPRINACGRLDDRGSCDLSSTSND